MKFEYKTMKIATQILYQSKNDATVNVDKVEDFEKELNRYGQEGWELIEMIQPKGLLGLGDTGLCIFKREIK